MNALRQLAEQIRARWHGEGSAGCRDAPEASSADASSLSILTSKKRPRLLRFPQREQTIYSYVARLNSDLTEAAHHLKTGSAVLVNLQNVPGERGQRIVDVMFVVCIGIEGNCEQVGDKLFLFAPSEYILTSEDSAQTDLGRLASDGFIVRERALSSTSLIDERELIAAQRREPAMRYG